MRDLLADNIALLNQLSSLHNPLNLPTINQTRLREVPSLISWVYCFNAYMAIRTTDSVTRNMLAYSRLIIREALRHGGEGWREYDRVFRRQLVVNPLLPWNTLEPGLLAATVLGQRNNTGGTYCAHCRESDHSSHQCALSSLQQQLTPAIPGSASQVATRTRSSARAPRRLETALNLCINWNRGLCERANCIYRHVCATCQQQHRARDCVSTPANSLYKTHPLPALPRFSSQPSSSSNKN